MRESSSARVDLARLARETLPRTTSFNTVNPSVYVDVVRHRLHTATTDDDVCVLCFFFGNIGGLVRTLEKYWFYIS